MPDDKWTRLTPETEPTNNQRTKTMTLQPALRLFFLVAAMVLFTVFTILIVDDTTAHHPLAWLGAGLIAFAASHI